MLKLKQINGISNAVREGLLQAGQGAVALCLDIAVNLDIEDFTVKQFVEAAYGLGVFVSERVVRRGLASSIWRPRRAQKAVGRPGVVYSTPDAGVLNRFYGSYPGRSVDLLYVSDLVDIASYRAGLHRELIWNRPGQYSRKWLSSRLGLSKNATRHYEREDWWRVMPKYEVTVVSDPESLPVRTDSRASWLVVMRSEEMMDDWLLVRVGDPPGRKLPLVRYVAWVAVRAGLQVYRVVRQPNYYDINKSAFSMFLYGDWFDNV